MKCSEVRWQLSQFLGGSTSNTEDELIRTHLDSCPDCALRLVSNRQVDVLDCDSAPKLSPNFTDQILACYPESPSGMMMVRHLAWVFIISASFAVAVYVFVRQMLTSAPLSATNPIQRLNENGLSQIASVIASNPLLNYVLLAVIAAVLCVALVLFVDRPTTGRGNVVRRSR